MTRSQSTSFPAVPFLWGAATSSHQVEGHNDRNDWWAWEQAGRTAEPSGAACDQYNRYEEDLALVAGLGHSAHRFSIEWSRIEPEEGVWDETAVEHYRSFVRILRQASVEPVVTLLHFALPIWLAEKGGWGAAEAPALFERYVRRMAAVLGPEVRIWITINEPMVAVYYGYLAGTWPPGKKKMPEALKALRNMLEAHHRAYHGLHGAYADLGLNPPAVSIAKHLVAFDPFDDSRTSDHLFAGLRSRFFNRMCLDALDRGFLFFPGLACEFLSSGRTLDFIGVNYYTRHRIRARIDAKNPLGRDLPPDPSRHKVQGTNQLGWETYPEGLSRVLGELRDYRLPLLICENGICTLDDAQRAAYIRDHLEEIQKARESGADIRGYFYWSLLDNFEWTEGFTPRFGLVEVDYASGSRKIRPSTHVLSELCRLMDR